MSDFSDFENLTIIDRLNITLSNLNMTHLIGKIKIYAGTTLPAGYVWCDGTTAGTPDLTNNKFIISDQSDGTQQQTGNNVISSLINHNHSITTSHNYSGGNTNFQTGTIDLSSPSSNNISGILSLLNHSTLDNINQPNGNNSESSGDGPRDRPGHNHKHNIVQQASDANANIQGSLVYKADFNSVKNTTFTISEVGNNSNYEPPYIHIGFIMKDPSTWL